MPQSDREKLGNYVCLFTCCSALAIDFELTFHMATESFALVLAVVYYLIWIDHAARAR